MATPKKRDVHVFLDTNIIRSESITEIVKEEVVQAIQMYNSYPDLRLHWVIPDLVRMERKDQMQRKANSHLLSLNILENLFDSDWLVNEESISTQIDRVIADQIKKLKIIIQYLDVNSTDWNLIISNAAFKMPPFSGSEKEKEKGFKDAIILETFKQYIYKVRARSKSHLIYFLTNDKLLRSTAIDSTKEDKFIQVFEGIEDFKNQVNQYSSKVTSEFADELVQKGAELFFQKDNLDTLYYKNEIRKQILKYYKLRLTELKNGATSSSIEKIEISKTIFVKKEGKKVYFSTRIQYTINNNIEVPKKPIFSCTNRDLI